MTDCWRHPKVLSTCLADSSGTTLTISKSCATGREGSVNKGLQFNSQPETQVARYGSQRPYPKEQWLLLYTTLRLSLLCRSGVHAQPSPSLERSKTVCSLSK